MVDMALLRDEKRETAQRLDSLRDRIRAVEAGCAHRWSEPVASTETFVEFVEDPSRPVHRGSDMWHESRAVERQRPVWTRTCQACLKVERTTRTSEVVRTTRVPAF